jgi:hypothetical protein
MQMSVELERKILKIISVKKKKDNLTKDILMFIVVCLGISVLSGLIATGGLCLLIFILSNF